MVVVEEMVVVAGDPERTCAREGARERERAKASERANAREGGRERRGETEIE